MVFMKNFDKWTFLKKNIEQAKVIKFANRREIWWCSLGENIGTEFCGKNDLYERPVLILKVFNKETLKVLPLTSKEKYGLYYIRILLGDKVSFGSLSQVKTMSAKRLSRKIGRINLSQFENIIKVYKATL